MKNAPQFITLIVIALGWSACSQPQTPEPLEGAAPDYEAMMGQLQQEAWDRTLEHSIDFRMKLGLPVTKLPDISLEWAQNQNHFYRDLLTRLEAIPEDALSKASWLAWQSLRWDCQIGIQMIDHFWLPFLGIPYSFPTINSIHQAFKLHALQNQEDVTAYLTLASAYSTYIDSLRERFESQAEKGILMPRAEIDLTLGMYSAVRVPAESAPLWVGDARLAALDADTAQQFKDQLTAIITEKVNPALTALLDYLDGPYREQAPTEVGLAQYPGGPELYRFLVRLHTTLDLTPEQIHQNGLDAVAALEARIGELAGKVGFEGERSQLADWLKQQPRFFAETPEQVEQRFMAYIALIEPRVLEFFSTLPNAPYGVARLNPALEGSMTYGYYQWPTAANSKGLYFYNGSKLAERSLLWAASLIYHELVPGHHFQLATQFETTQLTDYRRESLHTAFVEGWAEYASGLAAEMGGYPDPADELGRCFSEMFFAVRLVVDTGMNAKGWSLEQARQYMAKHLLESETQIRTETLRYSVGMPGQALAYRIGAEKFRELRRKAEAELGERFDIRAFHAAILETGSLPMTVLEQHIDRFIERHKN